MSEFLPGYEASFWTGLAAPRGTPPDVIAKLNRAAPAASCRARPFRPRALRRQRARVAPDYHIEIAGHFYSVPSRLIREIIEARITTDTVEIFHKGKRIASHARSRLRHRHTTTPEHMPSAHRRYAEWTPARMVSEAAELGPATVALFEAIMKAKPHPEQGFRSCLGIISLLKSYGPGRVEAACRRGNNIGATTYGSIASILKTGLDRAYAEQNDFTRKETDEAPFHHENIRGRDYYH
jgi:transposase